MRRLVQAAVAAGKLTPNTDPARLVRLIEAILPGSMLTWALYKEGAAHWIRADFNPRSLWQCVARLPTHLPHPFQNEFAVVIHALGLSLNLQIQPPS